MFGAVASPTVPKAFGIEALTADMRREPHFYAATDLANPFCLRARMTNRLDKSFKKTNTFAGTQLGPRPKFRRLQRLAAATSITRRI